MELKKFIKKAVKAFVPYGILVLLRRISGNRNFFFEVQLADHCNLNCVGCSHFSPVAESVFLDVDGYKKDCGRFSKLVKNHVHTIHLMGGEPLLHDKITEIMNITRYNFPHADIKIVTNGILLDRKDNEFWQCCNKNKIIVAITAYPVNLNIKKIIELSVAHQVEIANFGNRYVTKFRKDVYDMNGNQSQNKSFSKCGKSACHHLRDGRFYICPSVAYIKYINKRFQTNFEITNKDYIDIYQINNIKPILNYIKKSVPFCRYCNIGAAKHDINWSISKKDISEWT